MSVTGSRYSSIQGTKEFELLVIASFENIYVLFLDCTSGKRLCFIP